MRNKIMFVLFVVLVPTLGVMVFDNVFGSFTGDIIVNNYSDHVLECGMNGLQPNCNIQPHVTNFHLPFGEFYSGCRKYEHFKNSPTCTLTFGSPAENDVAIMMDYAAYKLQFTYMGNLYVSSKLAVTVVGENMINVSNAP